MEEEFRDLSFVDEDRDLGYFKLWLLFSQLLGAASIVLVSAWCGQYLGGFAWQSNPSIEFNYHPFFMILGLIFLYGEALLIYRVFRNQRKIVLKLLHFGLHTVALILASVALKAVFDSHNLAAKPMVNLYSLHSWVGLLVFILFTLQYLGGFLVFFYPGLANVWKSKYLECHVFFGLAIFIMAVAAALTGLTEKLLFSEGGQYKNLGASAVIGNLLGYCLVLFALAVVYIIATPQFRRQMLPEEVRLINEKRPSTTV